MGKTGAFLVIGIVMVIIAICFVVYALNNPQVGFPWSNAVTYGIYIIYATVTAFFITKGIQTK